MSLKVANYTSSIDFAKAKNDLAVLVCQRVNTHREVLIIKPENLCEHEAKPNRDVFCAPRFTSLLAKGMSLLL